MNTLRETLIELLEAEVSRNQIDYVLKFVNEDEKAVSILVDLMLFGQYPHANRAGWALDILDRKQPKLVQPHLEKIFKNLGEIHHDSVKRPALAILSRCKLPEKYQGFLIDYCFDIVQNPNEKIASKSYAIEILARITEDEPDLKGELFAVLDLQYKDASAGIKSRIRNIRKRFTPILPM